MKFTVEIPDTEVPYILTAINYSGDGSTKDIAAFLLTYVTGLVTNAWESGKLIEKTRQTKDTILTEAKNTQIVSVETL